jgi:hypothetical protein
MAAIPTLFAVLTLLQQLVAAASGNGPHLWRDLETAEKRGLLQARQDDGWCSCSDGQQCWFLSSDVYTCHDVVTVTTTRHITRTGPLTEVITVDPPAATTITQWTTITATTTALPESTTSASVLARRQAEGSTITSTRTITSYSRVGTTLFRVTSTRSANSNSPITSTALATTTVWTLANPDSALQSSSDSRSTQVGAIVGGIIGGVAALGFIIAAALWWHRRKRREPVETAEKRAPVRMPEDDESEINMRSMSPQNRMSTLPP